jgi:hypothetical protein
MPRKSEKSILNESRLMKQMIARKEMELEKKKLKQQKKEQDKKERELLSREQKLKQKQKSVKDILQDLSLVSSSIKRQNKIQKNEDKSITAVAKTLLDPTKSRITPRLRAQARQVVKDRATHRPAFIKSITSFEKELQQKAIQLRAIPKQEPIEYFTITKGPKIEARRFLTVNHSFAIDFNNDALRKLNSAELLQKIKDAIIDVFDAVVQQDKLKPTDRILVRFSLANEQNSRTQMVQNFDIDDFMDRHAQHFQSWENSSLADELNISITSIVMPRGGARTQLINDEDIVNKTSITQIRNTQDQMCAARAVLVGKARHNKIEKAAYYKAIMNSTRPLQTEKALELYEKLGKDPQDMCDLNDIQEIEQIEKVAVVIIDYNQKNTRVYEGNNNYKEKIYLLQRNNHYDLINSMHGYLGTRNYCDHCHVGYKANHRCKDIEYCTICNSSQKNHYQERQNLTAKDAGKYEKWTVCKDCNRKFPSDECYRQHKINLARQNLTVCEYRYQCEKCGLCNVEKHGEKDTHTCGQSKCDNCHKFVENDHQCFIQRDRSNVKNNHKYFFYDFESKTLKEHHIVNYGIVQTEEGDEWNFNSIEEFCSICFSKQTQWINLAST